MDAVGTDDFVLYVEQVIEPYTGIPLLGVSGFTPSRNWTIQVWYDHEVAIDVAIQADENNSFTTQLPLEDAEWIRVTAVGEREVTLYEKRLSELRQREVFEAQESAGLKNRFRNFLKRTARSFRTGEVLSLSRWVARISRVVRKVVEFRYRFQDWVLNKRFPDRSEYQAEIESQQLTPEVEEQMRVISDTFVYRPKISIVMPVYNVAPVWFRQAVMSVMDQIYDNWELCLADDRSTRADLLAEFAHLPNDSRIKLLRRNENGHICKASNTAASLASGDFIALLDHDDCLEPDALFEVVRLMQKNQHLDLIYTNEDKIDEMGRRFDPQRKPAWSPELLLSYNYINHFVVLRKRLFEQLGGFRVGYEGSQDHDLLLRVTEKTDAIAHIPKILYHWRSHSESTASHAGQKSFVHTSGRKAVIDAMNRRGIEGEWGVPEFARQMGLPILEFIKSYREPSVAIITFGTGVENRHQEIIKSTSYPNVKYYHVSTNGNTAEALNEKALLCSEDLIVFLKSDLVPCQADWLDRFIAHSSLEGVKLLTGKVVSSDGLIVSAGTTLISGDRPRDLFYGEDQHRISYYFYGEVTRNCLYPSHGVMAMKRSDFERLGGFNSREYPNCLFDMDIGLRIARGGCRAVYVGGVEFQCENNEQRNDDPIERFHLYKEYSGQIDHYDWNQSSRIALQQQVHSSLSGISGSKNRRVAVAAHNLSSAEGAPKYLSEIVIGLQEKYGCHPFVWSPNTGVGANCYREKKIEVSIFDRPWSSCVASGRWEGPEYRTALREIKSFLRKKTPDVVLVNTLMMFPFIEASAHLGIPCVWVIHESYSEAVIQRLFNPFVIRKIRQAFRLSNRIIAASQDTFDLFNRLNCRNNMIVINNGIPKSLNNRKKDLSSLVRMISIGTVCERKNQSIIVHAAAILKKMGYRFQITIIGYRESVTYGQYVQKLIHRLGVADSVQLVPETPEVDQYLSNSDLYLCSSMMEAFSRAIIEAQSYGLPIITTQCQGIRDQVIWGYNATPFDHSDPDSLMKAIIKYLEDPELIQYQSRRAFSNYCSGFHYDTMLLNYQSAIQSAIGRSIAYDIFGNHGDMRKAA